MAQRLGEEIVLRPRFTMEFEHPMDWVFERLDHAAKAQKDFIVTRVDHHIFIKIPVNKQHYWSPQLDLEVFSFNPGQCSVRCLFGPKPAVWTLFMFMHFLVGVLFIGFLIWAYTNYSLDTPFAVQLTLVGLSIIAWFVLYAAGRMGKVAGKQEMYLLYHFMKKTLKT